MNLSNVLPRFILGMTLFLLVLLVLALLFGAGVILLGPG